MRGLFSLCIYSFLSINDVSSQSSVGFSTFLSNGDNEININATIGDVFVKTLNSETNILSQGFLQKEIHFITEIIEFSETLYFAYPNPTRGVFHIKSDIEPQDQLDINQLSVFDFSGRLLFTLIDVDKASLELSLSGFESGVYFIKLSFEKSEHIIRVIKV